MEFYQFKKTGTQTTTLQLSDGIPVIKFKLFESIGHLRCGFSTRMGGVSGGCFASMNLSFTRGDDDDKVFENFRRFGKAVGIRCEQMVFSDQTHTANVGIVTEDDLGKGILRPKDYTDVDGLVTNVKGAALVTFYADCVPLFFVDEKQQVIALSHSGWRGTAGKIGLETVKMMKEQFDCRPENIKAAIGPSVCRDCYEVSKDVADIFTDVFGKENAEAIMTKKAGGKYMLDLWKANELVLLESGIRRENLAVTDICTCCNSEYLWSHRKHGGQRGSLAAFMMMAPSKTEQAGFSDSIIK